MEDKVCVKIDDKRTEYIKINQGVRQGCPLSPTLFNIFMSDFSTHLNDCEDKICIDERSYINCLLWADDILLMSSSEEGLSELLRKLSEYCDINKLNINEKRTKCMIFNKTGRLLRVPFTYKMSCLELVRSYKYLGFTIVPREKYIPD